MHDKIIKASPLFTGLSEKDYIYALDFFSAKEVRAKKGEILNTITKELGYFGLVLQGNIQVYMDDIDGNQIIMANNGPGNSFGESLCFLKKDAMVYIVAMTDAVYLRMNTERMRGIAKNELDLELKNRFISNIAERNLQMNTRIQILSKISIRDKLMAYFAQYADIKRGEEIVLPFNRNNMAVYLGVNRSALSRELGIMQNDGLIAFHKNKFRLL